MSEIAEYNKKTKLCLIEDIIKAGKTLYGLGLEEYKNYITDPGDIFSALYDLDLPGLESVDAQFTKLLNETIILKMKKQ